MKELLSKSNSNNIVGHEIIVLARKEKLVKLQQNYNTSQTKFVLCKSCFWCASKLYGKLFDCPNCNKQLFRGLPISENEKYSVNFDYNSVNLKFTKK